MVSDPRVRLLALNRVQIVIIPIIITGHKNLPYHIHAIASLLFMHAIAAASFCRYARPKHIPVEVNKQNPIYHARPCTGRAIGVSCFETIRLLFKDTRSSFIVFPRKAHACSQKLKTQDIPYDLREVVTSKVIKLIISLQSC